MKTFFSFSLFFSLFSLLVFCCSSCPNLIEDTCRTCSREDPNVNFDFCTTSLQAALVNQSANIYVLGKISIKLLEYNVTDTRSQAKQLYNKELDPNEKKRLADCFQLYDYALPAIKQAMDLYKIKQFSEANFGVTSVMDAASTCEEGFKEKGEALPELTKRNNDTFQLGAMVLSIMDMLQLG